jgi:hypothetical protein
MMGNERTPDVATVLIDRVDGGVTVLRFVVTEYRPTTPEERAAGAGNRVAVWTREATPENIAAEIAKSSSAWLPEWQPTGWRVVPNDTVNESTDRGFRDAWVHRDGKIEHDMEKVRAMHLDRLRAQRDLDLQALDREWTRATGQKKQKEADQVEAQRQALRDMPERVRPLLDKAVTVDDVKRIA